jgi:hypothetical protein
MKAVTIQKKLLEIFFIPFTLMRIIRLIPIIAGNFPPSDIEAARIGKTQGPFLNRSIVWCWDTPNTRVCSWFTAIRFRTNLKCPTEVIAWTPSLFGHRASIMELLLYHLRQYGILECCSCSLLLLWPTPDPSPSSVLSFQPWKYLMILKMVIIWIIHIIVNYMHYGNFNAYYSHYAYYSHNLWLFSGRMVGVC